MGATGQFTPHVGWANAVPDTNANVGCNVNGTKLSFSGLGYHHDKNRSDRSFLYSVAS